MWSALQAERRAGKTVLLEQLAAREEERQLAAETLARERAAMAVQVPSAAVVALLSRLGGGHTCSGQAAPGCLACPVPS